MLDVVVSKDKKYNMLGKVEGDYSLPEYKLLNTQFFYNNIKINPRAAIYAPIKPSRDNLIDEDTKVEQTSYGKSIAVSTLLEKGKDIFEQVRPLSPNGIGATSERKKYEQGNQS